MDKNWKSHFDLESKELSRPSATLTKALSLAGNVNEQDKTAIDLGCGAGSDTFTLLSKGWSVMAIDNSQHALDKIAQKTAEYEEIPLLLKLSSFESIFELPDSFLINASFSLPFCKPEGFQKFWEVIEQSILPGGYFAGHFFGPDDDWSGNKEMTFHDRQNVEKLLEGFEIEVIKEVNESGKTVAKTNKHWHVFHVVARKKS